MDQTFERSEDHPDIVTINMGPSHPATHGVLRLVLKLDGERVTDCVPHLGYLHRGMEKIAENRTYLQFMPYTDRMDYLSPLAANVGFSLAVEELLGDHRAAAVPGGSRVGLRAGTHRIASVVARHPCAGPRGGDGLLPHVQGPRVALRHRRGPDRSAPDHVVHAHRRRDARRVQGLAGQAA